MAAARGGHHEVLGLLAEAGADLEWYGRARLGCAAAGTRTERQRGTTCCNAARPVTTLHDVLQPTIDRWHKHVAERPVATCHDPLQRGTARAPARCMRCCRQPRQRRAERCDARCVWRTRPVHAGSCTRPAAHAGGRLGVRECEGHCGLGVAGSCGCGPRGGEALDRRQVLAEFGINLEPPSRK